MESSSDDSEDDHKLFDSIEKAKSSLEANPYHYDTHVELIKLLRIAGDLDGARIARYNMADIFPLDEKMWLEWLKDESTLITIPPAAQELKQLFERAVEDYLSVPIWLEYGQFSVDSMSEGFEYPREIYEKAIVAAGLHTSQGHLIWTTYREFEKAILSSLQEVQFNDPDNMELKRQVETQYERVDKLYKRQLAIPLVGLEETFQDYQSFSEISVSEDNLPNYVRAKKRFEELLPHEEQLMSVSPPSSSVEIYQDYIDKLHQLKEDTTLINTVYQRAITDCPLDTNLWKQYLKFLDTNFSRIKPVILKGYHQSIRNCPWVHEFWVDYVRVQERLNVDHEEIIATFEKAVGDNFTDSESYLQIWIAYCDYLRRRTSNEGSGEEEQVDLQKLFRRAREYLDTYFGKKGDPQDTLSRYQASLEARCYGNMEEARLLWTDVMTRHGNQAQYWLEFVELERGYGDLTSCRKLLLMSVNSVNDDPERVCTALLQFEREQGTLESFESAVTKCSVQLERIKERREKAAEKFEEKKKQQRKEQKKSKTGGNQSQQQQQQQQQQRSQNKAGKKRKMDVPTHVFFTETKEETSTKKMKVEEQSSAKTSAVESGPGNDESADMEGLEEFNPVGWLAREKIDKPKQEIPLKVQDDKTVFVSNLAYSTTKQELEDIFVKCGEIADVRLIKTRGGGGKLNVYAYIEYTSTEPVQQALMMDRVQLNNRSIFVSPCDNSSDKQSKYNDKATVYVSNIAHDLTEKQLEEIFQEVGVVKEVRLVRNRDGRSKGFGYIEYITESSAKAAVLKLDGHEAYGKNLKVAISNPPSKGPRLSGKGPRPVERSGIGSYQERKGDSFKDIPSVKRQMAQAPKTNISLVPRTLARRQTTPTTSASSQEITTEKKSNDDFRKLLYKQE